ncbi:hypothetical protein AB1Y20_007900 [Prymnesium parvum]|uniref:Lon N-terminal domain-containing protein n=1 Tax=Prymnesium parvum TaxID=97485 RepID=A0AB34IV49_PRYPA
MRHPASLPRASPHLVALCLAAAGSSSRRVRMDSNEAVDMAALQARIEQLKASQVQLLDLDAMVPRQKLVLEAPEALVEMIHREQQAGGTIGMVGRQRRQLFSHGVEVLPEMLGETADGHMQLALRAGRRFEVEELGEEADSRWVGRSARVRWVEEATGGKAPSEAARVLSAALEPLVREWVELVRSTGRERVEGQIDGVLDDLGPMPEEPNARALWVAGLINPLPALGVALEIRPAALMASSTEERLAVVEMGLRDSIRRLYSPRPPF